MQKPFLTALTALLILGQAPTLAAGKNDAAVDYNAGSSLSGESAAQPGDPNYGEGASQSMSEGGDSQTAPANGQADQTAPAPGSNAASTGNGTTGDASMDSMWSEPPSQGSAASKDKSGAKKKTRTAKTSKTRKSRNEDSALTNVQAPADSNSAQNGTQSAAQGTAQTAPQAGESPSADTAAAPAEPTNTAPVQPVQATTAPAASTPARQTIESDPVFNAKNAAAADHGAPLCTTQTFFQSELIRTVAWPGVGPFKGDTDPNDLSDPQENKLTLQTSGSKLTSAELILLHQPGNPQGFVNLEMVMDFMLEAMGVRDKRINDFNAFLEKHKEILAKNKATEDKPLTTSNGAYQISIAGSGKNNESSYLIQVKSKQAIDDAARAIDNEVRPVDRSTEKEAEASVQQSKPPVIASAVPPVKPKTNPVKETPAVKETVKETPKEAPASDSGDQLKSEFADTIRSWQSVKKEAVKSKDTAELGKFLSGKALSKQTLAIGWLTKEKKYYELTPKSVSVDSYKKLSQSPERYAVFAQVKEFSRLLDDGTNKLNKEEEAQYNVNYTIEKTGDHWTIYDSAMVTTPGAPGATTKSSTPATKTKH